MHQDESFLPDSTMPAFYYRGTHGQQQGPGLGAIKVGGEVEVGGAEGKSFSGLLGTLAGAGVAYWGIKKVSAEGVTKKGRGEGMLVVALGVAIAYFGGIRNL
jgi:hypothetical protein